ncbi:cystathionine beta-lyase [Cordyceps javanica]|uniref:Cystathionine beta-lyase n=1 Tax=Cordyceps javanica TaxID=43265 RepID=A0A545V4Z4_9HYPO|nr:cystathionine beta-lyase [Cordyceps javanica]TQW08050.1 cystathionine beta-lyase [Cordyceps javanica]
MGEQDHKDTGLSLPSRPLHGADDTSNPQEVTGLSLSSRLVHADDGISTHRAVAPAMHVSTTFRYSDDPETLQPEPDAPLDSHVYSRFTNPNTTRLEAILTSVLGGKALTYASGLAAFHMMLVRINPKRIAIGDGYHGCHGIIDIQSRLTGLQKLPLDCDPSELQPGDIIHVETPLNPTGEARDLQHYADKAHAAGAYLTVDATFAPPPLQDPFAHGADIVMHSGTKYFGGHSDMLCGVLALSPRLPADDWFPAMLYERAILGCVLGSMEGWLGLRSLRTLELRVLRQSRTATGLVAWLAAQGRDPTSPVGAVVDRVTHASLQPEAADETSWLRRQMPGGYGPVFSIAMKSEAAARRLPSKLRLFHHATSLGGVESLIEWRAMTDKTVARNLLRVSVGVESEEDLRADLEQAFAKLAAEV